VRRLRVSIDAVWTAVAVALPAFAALLAPLSTVDLAYQVRTGDLILAERAIPSVDPFTFSAAGLPWTVQQWAAAVALAAGFAPAGWAGLLVLRAAMVGAIFALVLVACRASGVGARGAALLTLGAFVVALAGLGLRAQLFGLLCFAAILALVALRRRRPRLLFLAPLVLLAWANLHGTFPLGLLALGWALLDDAAAARRTGAARPGVAERPAAWHRDASVRRDALVLVLAAVATCVTPYGPGVWAYAAALATSPAVAGLVSEWQATSIRTAAGIGFVASAIGIGALLAARGSRAAWPTIAWLAVLFALGAWTERGIAWWALGAAVGAATILAAAAETGSVPEAAPTGAPRPAPRRVSAVNGLLVVAICAAPLVLAGAVLVRPADPVTGPPGFLADAPPGITAAVRDAASPGSRILNAQRWGSWLEWAVPDAPVFTDSRFEVIPDAAWRDHVAVSGGRFDWRAIVDRIDPDLIVASRVEQAGLLDALAADPASGWREAYADAEGVVLVR
jgi:hypothetical protein